MMRPGKRRLSAFTYALFIRSLIDGPMTRIELAEELDLSPTTVSDYLRNLRKLKLVRVCGWLKDAKGAHTVEQFQFDPNKPDVARPKASPRERSRKYRAACKLRALQTVWTGMQA